VEFVSDGLSYIVTRGRWCTVIFSMCMHQMRRKVKIEKTNFYEELVQVLNQFCKYHTKILLVKLDAK